LQSLSQVDTEFWFVIPEASDQHGDEPLMVRISSLNEVTNITLSQPANPLFTPYETNIQPNSAITIDLTDRKDMVENRPSDSVLKKGLLITSTAPTTAYYDLAAGGNPELFTLKGKNALGTDFFIPSQSIYMNAYGKEAFDIVATEDNTTVIIKPSAAIVGHPADVAFSITLDRGETYSAEAVGGSAGTSLGGSRVISDKPISIMISDDSLATNTRGHDLIGDQIVPTGALGNEYVVIRGIETGPDKVYIFATEDSTSVFLDGSANPFTTIDAGENCSASVTDNTLYIKTDKPVYVYHITGESIGELASAVIPKLYCTGSKQTGFVRIGDRVFIMLLLTRDGNQDGFILNGSNNHILSEDFDYVPGTGNAYVYMHKEMTLQQVPEEEASIISNTEGHFQLGIIMPWKDEEGWVSAAFGYFSDFSNLNLGSDRDICQGDSVELDAGTGMISYEWSTGESTSSIIAKDSGSYSVEVLFDEGCLLRDTIQVSMFPVPSIDIGNDTIFTGNQITLDAGPGFALYLWQDGSTNQTYEATRPGDFAVQVTDENGCKASDEIQLSSIYTITVPNAFTPNGDGINDIFKPVMITEIFSTYSLMIFNRWGEKIFETNDPATGWAGIDCPVGTYIWILEYGFIENEDGAVQTEKGVVTLLR